MLINRSLMLNKSHVAYLDWLGFGPLNLMIVVWCNKTNKNRPEPPFVQFVGIFLVHLVCLSDRNPDTSTRHPDGSSSIWEPAEFFFVNVSRDFCLIWAIPQFISFFFFFPFPFSVMGWCISKLRKPLVLLKGLCGRKREIDLTMERIFRFEITFTELSNDCISKGKKEKNER